MQAGVQGRLCLKASSPPGGPGPPPEATRVLLLPCLLCSIWQSNRSSRSHLGRWLRYAPSSLQPLTTASRLSESLARWETDPACRHLRGSPQLLFHQVSDRGRPCLCHTGAEHAEPGKGGSSFITDGSSWRDSQQHLSSKQRCDFAGCC